MSQLEVVLVDSVAGVAGVVGLVALLGLALVARRWWLGRRAPTFELGVCDRCQAGSSGRGWTLGIGRYDGDRLEWFRVFSLSFRPKRVLERSGLQVHEQREARGGEVYALISGHVVAECHTPRGPVQLALSPPALTAMMAWLEAAPPGRGSSQVL